MKKAAMLFAFVLFAATGLACAQSVRWPEKPVRVIVPFAPGGASDVVARIISVRLADAFGQPFVVDNRAGAGGSIGAELVVRANPDGYTIMSGASSYASNAAFYKLPYDPIKGIAPVTLVSRGPFILTVHPAVKAANLREIIEQEIVKYTKVVKDGNIRPQ